jgi:hypothetical protein
MSIMSSAVVSVDVVSRWAIFVLCTVATWHLWIVSVVSSVVLAWVVISVAISASVMAGVTVTVCVMMVGAFPV